MNNNEPKIPYGYQRHFPCSSTDIATSSAVWIPDSFARLFGSTNEPVEGLPTGWYNPRSIQPGFCWGMMAGGGTFIENVPQSDGFELVPIGESILVGAGWIANGENSVIAIFGKYWNGLTVRRAYEYLDLQAIFRPIPKAEPESSTVATDQPVRQQGQPLGARGDAHVQLMVQLEIARRLTLAAQKALTMVPNSAYSDLVMAIHDFGNNSVEGLTAILEDLDKASAEHGQPEEAGSATEGSPADVWPPVFEGWEFVRFAGDDDIDSALFGICRESFGNTLTEYAMNAWAGFTQSTYIAVRGPLYRRVEDAK